MAVVLVPQCFTYSTYDRMNITSMNVERTSLFHIMTTTNLCCIVRRLRKLLNHSLLEIK